jgi:two-component system, OmpR family, heavy metal sensor histidine kinase CusS
MFFAERMDDVRRRMAQLSLRDRILFWFGVTLCAAIAGVCLTLYVALIAQTRSIDDQVLQKRLATVGDLIATEAERDYWLGHEVSEDMSGPRRVYIRVAEQDGTLIVETPGMAEAAPARLFPQTRGARTASASPIGEGGSRLRVLAATARWADGARTRPVVVQVATDTSLDGEVLAGYRNTLLAVVTAAILLGLASGAVWISRLLQPMARIAGEIGTLDLDNIAKPIAATGLTPELKRLVEQHNAMMARLGFAYEGLRHYADNAAHELRTPLNKLALELDVVLRRSRTEEEYRNSLSNAASDCRELMNLVERLLFLARISSRQAPLEKQQLDLGQELARLIAYFEGPAEEASVELSLNVSGGIALSVDRILLQRALTNVVSNALAHTPAGGAVTIAAELRSGGVRIVVRDTGVGISKQDLEHVFDRFYRGDKTRGSESGRVVLGLAITKAIVDFHDGAIGIESEVGRGATVMIDLPHAVASRAQAPALA